MWSKELILFVLVFFQILYITILCVLYFRIIKNKIPRWNAGPNFYFLFGLNFSRKLLETYWAKLNLFNKEEI